MANIDFGYIYVLKNPTFKENVYKIGYTERTVRERIEELKGTGIPTGYREVCKFYVPYVKEAEKIVHKELREKRISNDREFFECSMDEINYAISLLDGLYYRLFEEISESLNAIMQLNIKGDNNYVFQLYDQLYNLENYDFEKIVNSKYFSLKGEKVYACLGEVCIGDAEKLQEYLDSQKHRTL